MTAQPSSNPLSANSLFDEDHGAGEQRAVEAHEKTAECDDQDGADRAVAVRQHHAGRPTESRSTSLGSNTCCTSLLLVVDVS